MWVADAKANEYGLVEGDKTEEPAEEPTYESVDKKDELDLDWAFFGTYLKLFSMRTLIFPIHLLIKKKEMKKNNMNLIFVVIS